MKNLNRKLLCTAAATALLLPVADAAAAPLINLRLLGRNVTAGQVGFTPTVDGVNGDQIEMQLVAGLAPIGTVNGTRTITSKTDGVDGITNLKFNVYDEAGSSIETSLGTGTLPFSFVNGWGAVTGALGGVPTAGTAAGDPDTTGALMNVRPGQATGTFVGANSESVIGTTTISIVQVNSGGFVARLGINQPTNINTAAAGSGRYNGSTVFAPTTTSEAGTDPLIGLHPLAFVIIPEPNSIGLLSLAALGLRRLPRRRGGR